MSLPRLQYATVTDSRAGLARLTVLVALAVFLTDVASKKWALAALGHGYADLSLVTLTVVENEGLAFSLGAGVLSPPTVLLLRLAVLTAVVLLAFRFGPDSPRLAMGFALVLGGGLGNASDVMARDGAVVDFINAGPISQALVGSPAVEGPVLNLADLWILAGLVLLYPLCRMLGMAAQRGFQEVEDRILGRDWTSRSG